MKKVIFGLLTCLIIGVLAYFLGRHFPIVGGPIFAIIIGIIFSRIIFLFDTKLTKSCQGFSEKKSKISLNNFSDFSLAEKLSAGIKFSSKQILQLAIVLLGFEMNFYSILETGKSSLLMILVTLSTAFIACYLFSKFFKVDRDLSILVGVGTAICGGSAIAASSSVINAKTEDISTSMSIIFMFNVIAALIFPPLAFSLGLSDEAFGLWAGTAINDTSSVVAATSTWSGVVGNDTALELGTIVKLTRTLMIIPITIILGIVYAKKGFNQSDKIGSNDKVISRNKDSIFKRIYSSNFIKTFPWFIIFFLLAAVINTVFFLPASLSAGMAEISGSLTQLGKFFII
ncbi:MAG: YeiH family protein, partial [Anaerovoracaceae bacterium]